ncbi:uncharacterized protein CPUR_07080 [Claviceps purpurea 20.1]|uniref:F-box domain-containing protein n=1 Tax=Claviceps purpurea (strain 20.1) TaxID=1111077 RepID=M1W3Y9_CLAP2|nr:uncharacterized protein CPUR_07080 [Claviceps purpurea 20.1]
MWISPDRARTLLSNAIENKQLTAFDIVFPKQDVNRHWTADVSISHLEGYDWLRGNSTIHTLGCRDFSFSYDPKHEHSLLLPQFLATFPNLRTLSLSSTFYGEKELAQVVREILKVTHLKTIYTYLDDKDLRCLEKLARSKGTELIWGSEPRPWPIPLKQ